MKLGNLKVGTRLGLSYFVILLILALLVANGIYQMGLMQDKMTRVVTINNVQLEQGNLMMDNTRDIARVVRTIALLDDSAEKKKENEKIEKARQNYKEAAAKVESMLNTDEAKLIFNKIKETHEKVVKTNNKALEFGFANRQEEATQTVLKEAGPLEAELLNEIGRLLTYFDELNKTRYQQSEEEYIAARWMSIASAIAAVLLSIVMAVFITRSIVKPIASLQAVMTSVESGDLTVRNTYQSKDELGMLGDNFNKMLDYLKQFVRQVQDGAQAVASASQQISASSEEVASGAQTQAQEAQTLTKMMSDMFGAATQVANSAQKAAEVSEKVNEATVEGGKIIGQTVKGMESISNNVQLLGQDSEKIGEIIEIIDDIASQTNLLALNAAIEAARAGDAGKGFAVVADEVRKLAERSSQATKDIGDLIKRIQSNTNLAVEATRKGQELTTQAGTSFEAIKEQVKLTSVEINEIAAASEEQAATVDQAAKAVENVAAISEQSSAGAQQTAGATQSLSGLAIELQNAASKYKV